MELGRELGHHRGRSGALLALCQAYPDRCTDRCAALVEASGACALTRGACPGLGRMLRTLVTIHSLTTSTKLDPTDEACFEALEEVRAKMRMVDSWLKGGKKKPDQSELSF